MSFNTSWPADSVEFCPHHGSQDILVCGTYNLVTDDEAPKLAQRRRGKCHVFRVSVSALSPLQEIDLPAVLDLKYRPRALRSWALRILKGIYLCMNGWPTRIGWPHSNDYLARQQMSYVFPSTGQTADVQPGAGKPFSLIRSFDDGCYCSGLGNLIVSLSDGSLSLLRPGSQGELIVSDKWHAHDHEPWIAAWNYWHKAIFYSGGDDLQMKGWDERQGFVRPIFVNKRFDAGVTTIQSHPHIEHVIAVGSYDNKVRLFDTRKPLKALTDVDVGGGAWRVKWHPSAERKYDLLVACMHDGFKVVHFHPKGGGSEEGLLTDAIGHDIRKRFDQHESLAYGVDWSFEHHGGNDSLIASCSFYDCMVHLWSG